MNIGYLYGFNSYPPRGGGSIHVYHLTRHLQRLGHEIHTLGSEANPECANYSATSEGIRQFLNNIDLLYVRIDGSFLWESPIKRHCMVRLARSPSFGKSMPPLKRGYPSLSASPWGTISLRMGRLGGIWDGR